LIPVNARGPFLCLPENSIAYERGAVNGSGPRIKNIKIGLEEVPMQAKSSQNTHPNSAAGIGFLLGIGIVGVAIIFALLYALW
jgi:hypothetical protein